MDTIEEYVYSPEFDAVWNVIKDWDISREEVEGGNRLYTGATGTDVMTILNAIRPVKKKGADLTLHFFKGCRPKLGHYFIGSTKVLMIGPIRVFVSKDL
jgi:hypothetical protein